MEEGKRLPVENREQLRLSSPGTWSRARSQQYTPLEEEGDRWQPGSTQRDWGAPSSLPELKTEHINNMGHINPMPRGRCSGQGLCYACWLFSTQLLFMLPSEVQSVSLCLLQYPRALKWENRDLVHSQRDAYCKSKSKPGNSSDSHGPWYRQHQHLYSDSNNPPNRQHHVQAVTAVQ